MTLQQKRLAVRTAFFVLFVVAPPLDIFRFDLTLNHFILFGQPWTLGLTAFVNGEIGAGEAAFNIVVRGFLPIVIGAVLLIGTAWRYGRLYCGWLCPHFSVVEMINSLMLKASGKPTLWEPKSLPEQQLNGSLLTPDQKYWILVIVAVVGFAFLWAVSLLTYLLPPKEIYTNLFNGELTRNQSIFIFAATTVLALEFLLARHLFCRFGCAVGLFQSLAWMGNRKAMVVGFDSQKVSNCIDCNAACDNACPMRLKPRSIKRKMFTCTQCAQCIDACDQAQGSRGKDNLLLWLENDCARHISEHEFGHAPDLPRDCFNKNDQESN
ncbi:4Fe-4S binding protein [Candidatus Reidiella endopervernicosa]|uniref:4Fe-4S binding protein n=1 Tax=Candidatus Reidiella endopervernicosa TaxID=2738883 RepID=UPI001EF0BC2D|nr:4Fe-4S binding protein [Candidatus Reidiella endopervernicosa]